MKYKIKYRDYFYPDDQYRLHLPVRSQEIKARFFEIENGFVGIWTERNRNQDPDISVNVKDVLTITPIEEEDSNERDEQDDWAEIERENDEWFKCFSDEDEN